MRLVKEEAAHLKPVGEEYFFPLESFGKVIKALVPASNVDEEYKMEFVEKYVNEYDDIRYGFLIGITYVTVVFLEAQVLTNSPVPLRTKLGKQTQALKRSAPP